MDSIEPILSVTSRLIKVRKIIPKNSVKWYVSLLRAKLVIFFVNKLTASAETMAELYRNRWSVGLYFKWIKQHLRIKKLGGHYGKCSSHPKFSRRNRAARYENRTKQLRSPPYSWHLTYRQNQSRDLFYKSNFKNVIDLYDSSELNLFNF